MLFARQVARHVCAICEAARGVRPTLLKETPASAEGRYSSTLCGATATDAHRATEAEALLAVCAHVLRAVRTANTSAGADLSELGRRALEQEPGVVPAAFRACGATKTRKPGKQKGGVTRLEMVGNGWAPFLQQPPKLRLRAHARTGGGGWVPPSARRTEALTGPARGGRRP